MFKLGVLLESFRAGFAEGIRQAEALGLSGVQIYTVRGEMDAETLTTGRISMMRGALSARGLEVSAVCGDLGGHGFERPEENAWKIPKSKRILDVAMELGARIVTTHIGVIPEDTGSERYRIMLEACGELAAYAAARDMVLAVETGPEKARTLRDFLEAIGGKGMGVNYDPANFVMVTGQDPVEGVKILGPHIVHTHAKDGVMRRQTDPAEIYAFFAEGGIGDMRLSDYFLETPIGEGDVDFPAYLDALRGVGYDGYLTIEREVGDDPYQDIEAAVRVLRSLNL